MAIKSNIIDFPLKGELNLSKNKLDVNSPNEGGYLKNNAVIYGNVLSPVYNKSTGQQFDFMDASKNRYIINNGILYKNNEQILQFEEREFVKESLSLSHIDSLYDEDHYISIEADRAVVYGVESSPVYYYGLPFATNMISTSEFLILTKPFNTNSIRLLGRLGGTSINQTIPSLEISDLSAPVLNVHKYTYSGTDYYAISIITDSGSGMCSHKTVNYAWSSANGLHLMNIENPATVELTYKTIEKFDFQLYYYNYDYSWYQSNVQSFAIGAPRDRKGPDVYLHFQRFPQAMKSSAAKDVPIDTSVAGQYIGYSTEWPVNMNRLAGSTQTIYHHLTEWTIERDFYVNGFYWISIENPGATPWKDSYTDSEIEAAENTVVRFKLIPKNTGSSMSPTSKTHIEPETYCRDYHISSVCTAIESTTGQYCDAILNDGTIIQTQLPATDGSGVYEQGLYNFTGTFYSITYDSSASRYVLTYTSTPSEAVLLGQAVTASNYKYPYKPKEGYGSVSLGWNYYRNNIVAEGIQYKEEEKEGQTVVTTYTDEDEANSVEKKTWTTTILYDSGFANSNGGVIMQAGYNEAGGINAGSVVQVGNWRVLYINNLLAGISYSINTNQIGTLVTDWLTVSKILSITTNDVYYLDNSGIVQHVYIQDSEETKYAIIRDRFIVINTSSYFNCWDLKYNQSIHWASDWNNRAFEGTIVPNKLMISGSNNTFLSNLIVSPVVSEASAQNANYEMTLGRSVSSAIFPPELLNNVATPNTMIIRGTTSEPIDFYRADSGLSVVYVKSFKNNVFYKDVQLEGALYPLSDTAASSIMYNPNIFTKFVRTYNNNDMMISDNTAYPLMKYNGDIIMLALLTKGLENMQNIFVLQTLYYGIGDGKIWEIYYDNNTITNYQAIIDVKGMRYLGQLPTEALFWSPLNRSIYSFTGDAILRQLWHCNDISNINNTFYNPATQELFISTNIGLLCISNSYIYLLDNVRNVKSMFFYDDGFYIDCDVYDSVEHEWVEDYIKLGYEPFEGCSGNIHLATKYLGSIENNKIHINSVYVRLFKGSDFENQKFKIKEKTITDKSTETEYKECAINWDEDDWGYIRFQPQYQKGSSISFDMISDAPIISMSYGYNVLEENGQIGRNNI